MGIDGVVQRSLDRELTMAIGGGGSAEALVTLEDEHALSGRAAKAPAVRPPSPEPITMTSTS